MMSTGQQPVSLRARMAARSVPSQLRTLEPWSVLKHLGQGNTADVWLLEHQVSGQRIACKTPRDAGDAPTLSREAELARQLRHEHLAAVVDPALYPDLPVKEDTVATYWQFFGGGSLSALVEAVGKLSVAQTITVMLPLLHAVQYLHDHQIIHGDISPRNVLFDLTGRPVLIDLGATRATAHSFERTGTPGFEAPEIASGEERLDGLGATADVYSVAAVAWFCLTGSIPGEPTHRIPLVTLEPKLDMEIVQLLELCLSSDPAARPKLLSVLTAIGHWGEPEPVDLYSSVGEEYELLLPTRKPQKGSTEHSNNKRRKRRAGSITLDHQPQRGSRAVSKPHRVRTIIVFGTFLMLLCVTVTTWYAIPGFEEEIAAEEHLASEVSEVPPDVQGIVDALAKERAEVWAVADLSSIEEYAHLDSPAFIADAKAVRLLSDAGHSLDGLRMRGVVESAEYQEDSLTAVVLWQTDEYVQQDATGHTVQRVDAAEQQLELRLVDTARGWRLVQAQELTPDG